MPPWQSPALIGWALLLVVVAVVWVIWMVLASPVDLIEITLRIVTRQQ